MILSLYRGLTTLGAPLIAYYLDRRMARGKEDRVRFGERRGIPSLARPEGKVVWLHAASIGESVSMLPVIERLQAELGTTVLITTGTVTSAELMAERLPEGAIHQYVPVDRLPWVRRFLDHWRPDLALWAESEFWPNLLVETAERRVPLILLNGRISDRSFAKWRRQPRLMRRLLEGFVLCLGQTPTDADRLSVLGAKRVACRGNLKFAALPLPVDEAALTALAARMNGRPRWLAASTHPGEETLAGRVHQALHAAHPGLLTVIVPRHPNRGAEVAAELEGQGLSVARRGTGQEITAETQILLADTLGEMGLFIRLAPIVFMGKSLIGQGGQNPLEPARLGASVLFGPHMDNFSEIASRMCASGAAEQVADETALAEALSRRLADPRALALSGRMAHDFAQAEDDVLDAVLAEISPWLRGKGAE
ncbi:3-deoxy-D-manno-octulosonic acid transferase [Telmatospirillum siberiense]|uniref:3-deoxy-D-manno-octulosonic acid transferase n=1 Tax=Telmatospirillum siberiense TaxID=382514 RepID=A0A2N3PNS9_9PROT|nr:3-deoxy-D-manno-octulosonic acid transferase [Telmatospirillum siberiense]PKU22044.1 3-deoxy-D-manno-octulosonic acid transferase [Telmatospirillum siberiense]